MVSDCDESDVFRKVQMAPDKVATMSLNHVSYMSEKHFIFTNNVMDVVHPLAMTFQNAHVAVKLAGVEEQYGVQQREGAMPCPTNLLMKRILKISHGNLI